MADLTGQTLGNYTITEKLGRGGMADVYKAFHPSLSVHRAIKVIRPEFVASDDFRVRFQKEAQSVAALRHPNIVQIHDFGSEGEIFYMVMEFIEGQDLKKRLKTEGRIRPIKQAADIVSQIAAALQYAHEHGVVHRDIKPENIMLDAKGTPILMDFGIAKLLDMNTQLTQTGMGIGTPAYMAPEQAQGLRDIGPPADIYSLSIVLFEVLTGQVPYSADTPLAVMLKALNDPLPMPRQLSGDISEGLQNVILKGTAKAPGDRYPTAQAFQEALLAATSADAATRSVTLPQQAPTTAVSAGELPPSAPPPLPPPSAPKRGVLWAALAGIFAVVLAGAGWLYFSHDNSASNGETELAVGETGIPETDAGAPAPSSVDAAPSQKPSQNGSQMLVEFQGTTTPGETRQFEISAEQGDVLYLDMYKAEPITDFVLTTADGRTQVFSSYRDHGPVTLRQGNYTLAVTTRNNKPGEIDFILWRLRPAEIDGGELAFNQYSEGETFTPGQRVRYQFKAQANQALYFDVENTSDTVDFTLLAPDGRSELFSSYRDHGPILLEQAGSYILYADPRGDKVATFAVSLYNIDPPVIDAGELAFDKYNAQETQYPGQLVRYGVKINAGDTIFLDVSKTSSTVDFVLTAPDKRTQVFKSYRDVGPVIVEESGTYELLADPRNDATVEYEFIVWRVNPATIDGGTVQADTFVSGATKIPGQVVEYSFSGEAGQQLSFETDKVSATTDFLLLAPDGRTEVFKHYRKAGPVELPQTGQYRLLVDPRGDQTSSYEFIIRMKSQVE